MVIKIENYTKIIKKSVILDKINLEMESGYIYGFKGINGSGKTMLMRAICGLIYPTFGSVMIDNKTIGKDISFPESVGILIENPSFINNYTAKENLQVLASIKNIIDTDKINETLSRVGLCSDDKRIYRKYSLGMKQKLGIAAAVMESPKLIILDEPLNALDASGVVLVKEILKKEKKRGALIIISCHDSIDLEEMSDYIISLEDGKISGVERLCNVNV